MGPKIKKGKREHAHGEGKPSDGGDSVLSASPVSVESGGGDADSPGPSPAAARLPKRPRMDVAGADVYLQADVSTVVSADAVGTPADSSVQTVADLASLPQLPPFQPSAHRPTPGRPPLVIPKEH